jgi:MFS transporter, BCD family, chlorophyll transporter
MKGFGAATVSAWLSLGPRFMPFADAASPELPLPRLLRLAMFQISVGLATVLLTGTLNRVMIVEMGVQAWLVALMVSLPLFIAPFRALIGHKSDQHRSAFGWRRVPYIWYGTMAQWGGLAIMPFALLVLTDAPNAPSWVGPAAAALAFFMVGFGLHTTQTAGLALATDLAPEATRPRVVALLYVMLLIGMFGSALIFGWLLRDYTPLRLIQVIQGSAAVTMAINVFALWKQEPRNRARALQPQIVIPFRKAWADLKGQRGTTRLLSAVGLGAAAFSMQDILLEPYGGQILGLTVSGTTVLTALTAGGSLLGFAIAGKLLKSGMDPHRLAAFGAMIGVVAFSLVIFSAPFDSASMFRIGVSLIGVGGGLYSVSLMIAIMDLSSVSGSGLALGAWGAVQATAAGLGLALGGAIKDGVSALATSGQLGIALSDASIGYSFVYHIEIGLLFASLIALGPLVRRNRPDEQSRAPFGLAELPG